MTSALELLLMDWNVNKASVINIPKVVLELWSRGKLPINVGAKPHPGAA